MRDAKPQDASVTVSTTRGVVIAVPKGRILAPLAERLAPLGVAPETLLSSDRRLVRKDARTGLSFLLLKPDDVPTYVEYGTADLGVVGRDVLVERRYDLYAPIDLGIGRCRMVVAGPKERVVPSRTLRVATKYPHIASRFFAERGEPIEIIFVQGSVELAPETGLADVIVDLVESGETLRQNGLVVLDEICAVSSVVVVNRAGLKLKGKTISRILEALARPTPS